MILFESAVTSVLDIVSKAEALSPNVIVVQYKYRLMLAGRLFIRNQDLTYKFYLINFNYKKQVLFS
jgi:hypothetical protein